MSFGKMLEREGYADGLAGIGAGQQCDDNDGYDYWLTPYGEGFLLGSLDRKTMLTRNERQPRSTEGFTTLEEAFAQGVFGDAVNDDKPNAFATWAEGMGDGDA
jgi:hypothetical protein